MSANPDHQIELLRDALRYAENYLGTLDQRNVYPDSEALDALDEFDEPLPAGPSQPSDTLAMLHGVGGPVCGAT